MLQKRLFGMNLNRAHCKWAKGSLMMGVMLVFSLVGCDNGTTGNGPNPNPQPAEPQSVTYVSKDDSGNLYTLVITEKTSRSARYAAKNGDSFTFTVELFNNGVYSVALTYSGTVESAATSGTGIAINITVNGKPLTITVVGTEMTIISGEIVNESGETVVETPETLIPTVDKRALQTAINAANTAKGGVVVSTNGTDVLTTVYWISQTRMDAFTTAITTAQAVYDNASADQSMADYAKIAIETATTVFNGQKQLGTKTEGSLVENYKAMILGQTFPSTGSRFYWTYKEGGTQNAVAIQSETFLAYAIDGDDVYFGGASYATGRQQACYWKNGTMIHLLTEIPEGSRDNQISRATGITIENGNIYVAGQYGYYFFDEATQTTYSSFVLCYWMNGIRTDLQISENQINPSAIAVSGNDIYILSENSDTISGYWKNSTWIDFPNDGAVRNSITVFGSDMYIVGSYDTGSRFKACYWKNGTKVDLEGGTGNSYASDIVIVEGNVFIAGSINSSWSNETNTSTSTICYWLNGELKPLLPNQINSGVLALSVVGEEVPEPVIPVVDKRALQAAINAANTAKENVVVSVNGTDILTTVYWVTQARMNTFTTAITTAQAVYDNEQADQSMVDYAKIAIETATTVFNGQKQLGTKTGGTQETLPGIYVVGNYTDFTGKYHSGYWLDSVWHNLPLPSNAARSQASSIAVSGNNIYICGEYADTDDNYYVGYWRNGVWQELAVPSGSEGAGVSGIAVSGSNVYIAGTRYYETSDSFSFHAGYWLNGTWHGLSEREDAAYSSAFNIAISGNDVAIGGYCRNDSNTDTACYWLNGTRHDITGNISVTSIALSGGNVHAVAIDDYYINGVKQNLGEDFWADLVAVSGSTVFLTGEDGRNDWQPSYMINGNRFNIPITGFKATSIKISNGNYYIAGSVVDYNQMAGDNWKRTAYLWSNNVWETLVPPSDSASCWTGSGFGFGEHAIVVVTE